MATLPCTTGTLQSYLLKAGTHPEGFSFYDISDPRAPVEVFQKHDNVALSQNGLDFEDKGEVINTFLHWPEPNGDEIIPSGVLQIPTDSGINKWVLWFSSNSFITGTSTHIGLATGVSPQKIEPYLNPVLTHKSFITKVYPVLHPNGNIGILEHSGNTRNGNIRMRQTSIDDFENYTEDPLWTFSDTLQQDPVIFADMEAEEWKMYYVDFSGGEA